MARRVVGLCVVTSVLVCIGCGGSTGPTPSGPGKAPAVTETALPNSDPALCSSAWEAQVERRVGVSDAEGHGPDLGSSEWMSAVEFRLGVRDQADFPEPGTPAWCERVDSLVESAPR